MTPQLACLAMIIPLLECLHKEKCIAVTWGPSEFSEMLQVYDTPSFLGTSRQCSQRIPTAKLCILWVAHFPLFLDDSFLLTDAEFPMGIIVFRISQVSFHGFLTFIISAKMSSIGLILCKVMCFYCVATSLNPFFFLIDGGISLVVEVKTPSAGGLG